MKRGLRSSITSLNNPATSFVEGLDDENNNVPTDPYFPLQWYLRNTGQNGGKIHLDLNVQAAWDQGITGKNVTTAIMDDGKIINLLVLYSSLHFRGKIDNIKTFIQQVLIICIRT